MSHSEAEEQETKTPRCVFPPLVLCAYEGGSQGEMGSRRVLEGKAASGCGVEKFFQA